MTHKGSEVWYVDPDGTIHLFIRGASNDLAGGDGQRFDHPSVRISEPRAITMDVMGNLILTENDGGFIRRINRVQR